MNLYDVTVVLTVEADNADEASDSVMDEFDDISWIKDYDIKIVRKLPLVREDAP